MYFTELVQHEKFNNIGPRSHQPTHSAGDFTQIGKAKSFLVGFRTVKCSLSVRLWPYVQIFLLTKKNCTKEAKSLPMDFGTVLLSPITSHLLILDEHEALGIHSNLFYLSVSKSFYNIDTRAQCYKNYRCNLLIFIIG